MDSNHQKLLSDVPRKQLTPLRTGPINGAPLLQNPKRETKPPQHTCPNHSTGKPGCSDPTCRRYIPVVKVAAGSRRKSPTLQNVALPNVRRVETHPSTGHPPRKESVVPAVIRVPTVPSAASHVPEVVGTSSVRTSSPSSCHREVLIAPCPKKTKAPPDGLRVRVPPDLPVAPIKREILSKSLDASDVDDPASACSSPSDYSTWSTAATGSSETADTPRTPGRSKSTITTASDLDSDAGIYFPIRRAPASVQGPGNPLQTSPRRSRPAPAQIQTPSTDPSSVAECSTRTKISSRSGDTRSSTTRARTPSDSRPVAGPSGKSLNAPKTPSLSSSSSTLAQRPKIRPKQEANQGSYTAHARRDPLLVSHSSQQPLTETHTQSERSESRMDCTESELGFNILVSEYGSATPHHPRHAHTVRVTANEHRGQGERYSRPQSQVSVPDSDSGSYVTTSTGSYVTTSTVQSRTPARPVARPTVPKSQSMCPLGKSLPLSVLEARARADGFARYADTVPESTRAVNNDSVKGKAKATNMVVGIFKSGLKPKEPKRLNPKDLYE